ncbi:MULTISPECIES: RICIN domain-containing protein [unclassified Kribbella]|uniref:RICIN domain-containing protein n=1 Tax=unclassified Kribbella TaxID=2644121 RepID=UPI0033EAC5EA
MTQPLRRIAGSALSVTVVAIASGLTAAPAQAAPYYAYKNEHSRTCLTGGKTGTVFVSSCNGSWYQQWTWAGGDEQGYYRLKNRATGECLMTDYKSQVNAVWTSRCSTDNDVRGQLWRTPGYIINRDLISLLRTSPTAGAVYSDKSDSSFDWSYYEWHSTTP